MKNLDSIAKHALTALIALVLVMFVAGVVIPNLVEDSNDLGAVGYEPNLAVTLLQPA